MFRKRDNCNAFRAPPVCLIVPRIFSLCKQVDLCYTVFMKRWIAGILCCFLLLAFESGSATEELIQQGSQGEPVVRVQLRLFDLGYYMYKPTGNYQTVTRLASTAYQVASGLMSDGSIGQETAQSLFSVSAKRAPFHAEVPLSFTAQGTISKFGIALPWSDVRTRLTEHSEYSFTNAATKETCRLSFVRGENHAEFQLPASAGARHLTQNLLKKWLGETNSFYKCGVLLDLDGQSVSASMQWNGKDSVCVYFNGSTSHVFGLPDREHETILQKISYSS